MLLLAWMVTIKNIMSRNVCTVKIQGSYQYFEPFPVKLPNEVFTARGKRKWRNLCLWSPCRWVFTSFLFTFLWNILQGTFSFTLIIDL